MHVITEIFIATQPICPYPRSRRITVFKSPSKMRKKDKSLWTREENKNQVFSFFLICMKILRSICVCTSSSQRPMSDYGFRLKFVSIILIRSYNTRSMWIFQTMAKRLKPAGSTPVTRYAFTHPDLPSEFGRVLIVAKDSYILQGIRLLLNDMFKKKTKNNSGENV